MFFEQSGLECLVSCVSSRILLFAVSYLNDFKDMVV